jgi:hypothetical protein
VPNLLLAYIIAKFAQTQTVIQSNKDKIVQFDIFFSGRWLPISHNARHTNSP